MLRLYNRILGKFELFKPLEETVKIFVCGPTLYDDVHLGHLRVLLTTDLVNRYLKFLGLRTEIVINLTDMDIKILEKAQREKVRAKEIADRYFDRVTEDIQKIINDKVFFVRPSKLIQESTKIILDLLSKNLAYETKEGIYCDISRSKYLGSLSKLERNYIFNLLLEPSENKRNPCDFKLWLRNGDEIDPKLGNGMVGWHLQDFTVIENFLGGYCDIHIGAKELIFPHHEFILLLGEYYEKIYPISRYFIHMGLLNYKGEKMSKSLGNIIYYRDIMNKYDMDVLRIYYYLMKINRDYNFNFNSLYYAQKIRKRLKSIKINKGRKKKNLINQIEKHKNIFLKYIGNNLNSHGAIKTWLSLKDILDRYNLDEKSQELLKETLSIFSSITGILERNTIE
ncbi:MAG: class I tRNA ligase family protein [Thermoproteota archaeon]|jgi:cysteinyl-tRNA synthetase|nr:class I tRNA ligase family protein [Thermoproteota archaeon]